MNTLSDQIGEIFQRNFIRLMNEKNVNVAEVARGINKSYSTVSDWKNGAKMPRGGNLELLSDYFNVNLSDLTMDKSDLPNDVIPVKNLVKIPRLGKIACGDPIDAVENVNSYKEVPEELLPSGNKEDLFYLEAQGDSMEPKIPNGSDVLCRKQPDVENGEIAAVLLNDFAEVTLKRVKKTDGFVVLEPLNDNYDTRILTPDSPGRIVGKAVKVEYNL